MNWAFPSAKLPMNTTVFLISESSFFTLFYQRIRPSYKADYSMDAFPALRFIAEDLFDQFRRFQSIHDTFPYGVALALKGLLFL